MTLGASQTAARSTFIFCVLVALCEGIDLQAAGVAAGGISAEFHPTTAQLGTFFSASTFGLFIGALIGGRLADSIGRKAVLVTSVGLFGFFSLLTPIAWDIASLTWARLFTGLGIGGALPMLLALVSESGSAARASPRVAMVYAATPFGGAGASLISLLIAAPGWRLIFIVGGVLPIILTPLMAFGLKESAAFINVRAESLKRGNFAAIFAGGRALTTILLWLSFFAGLLLLYLLLNWLPLLLVSNGLTRTEAAGAQIGFNIGGAAAALLIGFLLGGRLRNWGVIVTFGTLPVLLVVLARAPHEIDIIATVVFLLGCSVMAAQAFLYAMAPIPYPTIIRGVGVGSAVAAGRIGSFVGPKLAGILKSAGHDPARLLMDLVPVAIFTSICALLLAWETQKKTAYHAKGETHGR